MLSANKHFQVISKKANRWLWGLGFLAIASSCDSEVDPSTPSQGQESSGENAKATPKIPQGTLAPIVKVMLSERHAFEIYDYGTAAGYSETGTYSDSPVQGMTDEDFSDPVNVFAKLAPKEPLPESLLRLSARVAAPKTSIEPDGGTVAETHTPTDQPVVQLITSSAAVPVRQPSSPAAPAANAEQTVVVVPAGRILYSDETTYNGAAGGRCPFTTFSFGSGPLGPFCPASGSNNTVWCAPNLNYASVNASNLSTGSMLATICTDSGTAEFNVRVYRPMGGSQTAGHTSDQPAGTWRQWRIKVQSWCDSVPWYCPWCTPACFSDNPFGAAVDVTWNGATFQFGGYWNPR
jgi:hypothetical protein